jgi:hypothetical protein
MPFIHGLCICKYTADRTSTPSLVVSEYTHKDLVDFWGGLEGRGVRGPPLNDRASRLSRLGQGN